MNAPLGKIYLMTADHCFTDKTEVSDFEFWMLLFNYYTQCGNDTSPPVTQLIQVRALSISLNPLIRLGRCASAKYHTVLPYNLIYAGHPAFS